MLKINITAPVEEPADSVNSMVVLKKPTCSLQIYIDPRNLNQAIKRPYYAIPTTEEILSRMGGAKRFTKLDGINAYWQIPIDESSSKLLNIQQVDIDSFVCLTKLIQPAKCLSNKYHKS